MKSRVLLLFLAVLFFLFPRNVSAEVIRSFDTQIVANKDGTMNITESIIYDFEKDARHGIFRYIPTFSKIGDLYRIIKIRDAEVIRDGEEEKFEETKDSEKISFKIGDPDRTITGPHTYRISYVIENGIGSNYASHDEIYWNITGNDWPANIEKATARVITSFDAVHTGSLCFTGYSGEKEQNCTGINGEFDSAVPLTSGEGMTIVEIFPAGTFPKSILSKDPPMSAGQKIGALILKYVGLIYLLLNVLLPGLLILWYQKKKNKKRFGAPSVNFDTPEDLSGKRITPAEAGTIDTARLERDDIVATIFDLAIRRYIRLEEIKTVRKLIPDAKDQKIVKLKDLDEKLNDFEKVLMRRLFVSGDEVKTSSLKKDFYVTFESLEEEMFKDLVKKGYYVKNPKNQRALLAVLGMMALFTGNIILAIVLFWLGKKLIGRTKLGDEVDFRIDGLKLFLKGMDRNYKWQAEKFYTVEQMIPYAVSLGYIEKFMGQMKILKPDYNPTWYSGYLGSFYGSYAGFYSSMSSSVTTSASSSSSGSSGGSSGGGGGGGGGGSW
ncbi:MAG: hypothetical protein A2186_02475 [Candidatus Levybacteria bacterium RIFOXYA1_FULL_41_10]|nr:MAG: hypothetical protein UT46_C0004G0014 [Candidatus Levybacteria bacterium GW2011_GWA1_39_34]KKR51269.1 MAG: hypothetical protein UT87_C0007G0029 [Candidatus Levybacteria bacterium GW2011_GWC1_40_19]KKR94644.1 MAG: hypothetical protein UU45_C0008G0044 [Candidatus Levybacteria bacterium GW2011_GWA2_41_15]OGH20520.1 MAG: hypothetical protein A2695_01195 [Candidatus Levybacteria bacterium RIFCSPHIGHO2_01_FULL_40_83]OGH26985.1 MAG: hypothetical protein A3D82_02710 [Candidatus Levybacteria bact